MQDLERMRRAGDLDAAERAPGAADEVEPLAARREAGDQRRQRLADRGTRLSSALGEVAEPLRPERRGDAPAGPPPPDRADFHGGAAEVHDQPARRRIAEEHALGGQPRLVLAGGDAQADAGLTRHLVAELGPVLGLAHGRGGDGGERADAQARRQRHEAVQRPHCPLAALGRQPPRLGQLGA